MRDHSSPFERIRLRRRLSEFASLWPSRRPTNLIARVPFWRRREHRKSVGEAGAKIKPRFGPRAEFARPTRRCEPRTRRPNSRNSRNSRGLIATSEIIVLAALLAAARSRLKPLEATRNRHKTRESTKLNGDSRPFKRPPKQQSNAAQSQSKRAQNSPRTREPGIRVGCVRRAAHALWAARFLFAAHLAAAGKDGKRRDETGRDRTRRDEAR